MNTALRILCWTLFFYGIAADSITPPVPVPIGRDTVDERAVRRRIPHRRHRHEMSPSEQQQLREFEEYEQRRAEYVKKVNEAQDQYYGHYFEQMRQYAAQVQLRRYQDLLERQRVERERIAQTMGEFGVPVPDLPPSRTSQNQREEERPKTPFGDLRPVENSGRERTRKTAGVTNMLERQAPSQIEPRPENREIHRKAVALEELCARFVPTVRKHCFDKRTAKEYVKRCAAYFHDCQSFLPKSDPLYNIANAFNSNVGLNLGTVEVNGIPYYPINEEGSIGVGRVANVPFGSWGGGYSENLGVRDYWSQTMEVGANWYEGKYGYKSGWSVPLVQSLGIEGDTHALVSVPTKQGELGKPIGVDVGGGVGPYYQQNQHVGVDYLNGKVGTNFGVGVPFAGVGVNTGLGISFPSVNDVVG
uniref:Secreted protein n=1 Tax=Haemonchus contortus TaxID=6289 RepID=A0A7I4Y212_HAECO